MINWKITLRLLAFPIIWMGVVQLVFAALSLFIFKDRVIGAFLIPAATMICVALVLLINLRKTDLTTAILNSHFTQERYLHLNIKARPLKQMYAMQLWHL
ncbi:hypothetical protein [Pseudoalteromonas ostreae]|uniref:hypothetical protein n=1 Tax=Pseudoalteromonas ostreae TaxID=2774154 RepID=UPI001B377F93|nr:hypothetical protein [Pseudoalteromonas ostreae]